MLKRLSTFRKKKNESTSIPNGNQANGANGNGTTLNGKGYINGNTTTNGHAAVNGSSKGTNGQKPSQGTNDAIAAKHQWSEPDHSVTRGDVESSFEQFAQLIHSASRPLPTQTGDGSYIEHEASSSLFQDLRHLGFKDVKTLVQTVSNKASGALTDDKTMLMEHIIQVSGKNCLWRLEAYLRSLSPVYLKIRKAASI